MPAILTTLSPFALWRMRAVFVVRHLETVLAGFIEAEFPDKLKVQ